MATALDRVTSLAETTSTLMTSVEKVLEKFDHVPFGNSKYQIEKFIIDEALTPARKYRTIGLQLFELLKNLGNTYFDLKEAKLEMEELQKTIDMTESNYARQKAIIQLERKQFELKFLEKLVLDASKEVKIYLQALSHFDDYISWADFEAQEEQYFKELRKVQAALENQT